MSTKMHEQDIDCAPFLIDEQCTVCGVSHSGECPECGGKGFHKPDCPNNDLNWGKPRKNTMKYKTGRLKPRQIDLKAVDFAVDTALSWEGKFPNVGHGDYLVTIGHVNGDPEPVLVSRRYTSARDTDDAAKIALSAFAERHSYETDDKGDIIGVTIPDVGTGSPCWVERVDIVTK